jgi:FMN phosphatase YigB (HAD superfamily)
MNPTNTIIAFDLHSVIFTLNYREAFSILWRWPHKVSLFLCGFRIRLVWKCLTLLFHNPTDEEYFALFQQYCPKLLPLIIELFNAFIPVDSMVDLLKELKENGYELHILSNIGPRRFEFLQKRYPDIIALFDKVKITNGNIRHLIKKPNLDYFMSYLRDCNPRGKLVLFIDDKKRNIEAANAVGIIGIKFTSADKLRCTLSKLTHEQ